MNGPEGYCADRSQEMVDLLKLFWDRRKKVQMNAGNLPVKRAEENYFRLDVEIVTDYF